MSLIPDIPFIAAGILGTFTAYLYYFYRTSRSPRIVAPLPPGPRKLPIIGNALDMPTKLPAQAFAEMGKKFSSDIIHLNVLGTNIIVLNSYDMAQALLDKRSSIYSSRPRSMMLHELKAFSYMFAAFPYNTEWRMHRRLFVKYLHPDKTEINRPRETEHIHILLGKLLESPDRFMTHIRHMVGSISISIVYGLKIKSDDDPYINVSEKALEHLNDMITPGAFLVETFPILKIIPEWFPGARFHQIAKKSRKVSEEVVDVTFKASSSAIDEGNISPCVISEGLVDIQNNRNVDQCQHLKALKEVGVTTYLASMDTTYASLTTFILMMMLHPEVQKTAQRELDRVLGDRLPVHDDIPSIPYMTALFWEILRWETPGSTGFSHCNTEEDIFEGYYIPKGSIIVPNQRAMLQDERLYPDPGVFKPERFIKAGKLNGEITNPENIAFGFGRRICPGRHIAKSTLLLSMACMLSTFNVDKPVDKYGEVVQQEYKFSTSGITQPEPFTCVIKPRSKMAISFIQSLAEE